MGTLILYTLFTVIDVSVVTSFYMQLFSPQLNKAKLVQQFQVAADESYSKSDFRKVSLFSDSFTTLK